MFTDRVDAGQQLAARLREYAAAPDTVVLGIPRGGVVVAAEVARALNLPLDIVLAAKVGAPANPEFAVGAVTADGEVIANPLVAMSESEVLVISGAAREKVAHQLASLRGSRAPLQLAGLTAIVVDDGVATGLTALAAVRYLKRQGASVVFAAPVAAAQAAAALSAEADRFVAVLVPDSFLAVGQFYVRFGQTADAEVRDLLGVDGGSPTSS